MIWNVATLVACLVLLLIFRRVDRANVRIMKLKRFADKTMHDFKDFVASENRKYSDSTIEMDLLLKKSGTLSESIKHSLIEVEAKLKGIDAEKATLKKVEDDLRSVIDAAHDLNAQLKYIDSVKSGFGDLNKRAAVISETIMKLEKEQTLIVQAFNDRVRSRAHELSEELAVELARLKESVTAREGKLIDDSRAKVDALVRSFSDSLVKLESSITDTGDAILETVRIKIDGLERSVDSIESRIDMSKDRVSQELTSKIEGLSASIHALEGDLINIRGSAAEAMRSEVSGIVSKVEKAEVEVNRVAEKLRTVEDTINGSRMKFVESLHEEQNRIRLSMDELNIQAITKKDEIVKAARREIEQVANKIESFDERYGKKTDGIMTDIQSLERRFNALMDKTASAEDSINEAIDSHIEEVKGEFRAMDQKSSQTKNELSSIVDSGVTKMREEFGKMEDRLSGIRKEITDYEESNRVFSRTDELMHKVDTAVRQYNAIIEESETRAAEVKDFLVDVSEFREARKQIEKELKLFQSKRDSFEHIESEIQGLLALADAVKNKADVLEMNSSKIDQVDQKIRGLASAYGNIEKRIGDLHEYEDVIAQNLDNINKIDVIVNAFEGRVMSFEQNLGSTERKISKLKEYCSKVEESTITLRAREQEIRTVMDKFQELDLLSDHLEERVKQISVMLSRVESMRSEIEQTDSHLQSITTEANKKIKQLTDIVQTVPSESGGHGITKQMKGSAISKGVNDAMVKMVRDLSTRGWTPNDIAKNMMLEENTVRLIINTSQ